jgi:hypothetical protein
MNSYSGNSSFTRGQFAMRYGDGHLGIDVSYARWMRCRRWAAPAIGPDVGRTDLEPQAAMLISPDGPWVADRT